jgi:hypothetical protein
MQRFLALVFFALLQVPIVPAYQGIGMAADGSLSKRGQSRQPGKLMRRDRSKGPLGLSDHVFSALEGKMQDLQTKFAGGACQTTQTGDHCTDMASQNCHWPPLKKFDLVISWVTFQKQSNITSHNDSHMIPSFLQVQSSSGFENQAEIKYALRSYEQYGLLDHVRTIYILMDESVLERFGAPRFFDYNNTALRIVTDRDLGTKYIAHPKFEQFYNLDRIPGLSDYFLWMPDDNFMQKPLKMEYLYDANRNTPFLHSYGTYKHGWCDSNSAVGSTHGPVMMNKCAYTTVANQYWRLLEGGGGWVDGVRANHTLDVLCLYTHAMQQSWPWKGYDGKFHSECHTNGGCHWNEEHPPLFLNVQGNAISDEYNDHIDSYMMDGLTKLMPNGYTRWFHDRFPSPSRVEKTTLNES